MDENTNKPTLSNNITNIATQELQREEIQGVISYYKAKGEENYAVSLQDGLVLTEQVTEIRNKLQRLDDLTKLPIIDDQVEKLKELIGEINPAIDFREIPEIRNYLFSQLTSLNVHVAKVINNLIDQRSLIISKEHGIPEGSFKVIPVTGFFVDSEMLKGTGKLEQKDYYKILEPSVIVELDWDDLNSDQQNIMLQALSAIRRECAQYGALIQISTQREVSKESYHTPINTEALGDSIEGIYHTEELNFTIPGLNQMSEFDKNVLLRRLLTDLSRARFYGGTFVDNKVIITYVPAYEKYGGEEQFRDFPTWVQELSEVFNSFNMRNIINGSIILKRKVLVHYDEDISDRKDNSLSMRITQADLECKEISKRVQELLKRNRV